MKFKETKDCKYNWLKLLFQTNDYTLLKYLNWTISTKNTNWRTIL